MAAVYSTPFPLDSQQVTLIYRTWSLVEIEDVLLYDCASNIAQIYMSKALNAVFEPSLSDLLSLIVC